MHTELMPAGPQAVAEAVRLLRAGETVALPTETVYGLAADAGSGRAVKKIFEAKGRPQDNPLIVHIADLQDLPALVRQVPPGAEKLAAAFWPGPLTIILEKTERVSAVTSAGLDTVGVRMPDHPVIREVIRASGLPLAAPSANLSGLPSPTTARATFRDLEGRVPLVIDGGACGVGVESTVITLAGPQPVLLRPGYITREQLAEVLGQEVQLSPAVLEKLREGEAAASPGMKYKHYSPRAEVILLDGPFAAYKAYVEAVEGEGIYAMCYEEEVPLLRVPCLPCGRAGDPVSQAQALFEVLRRADDQGARVVYAHRPPQDGIFLALYNRLIRAAAYRVVKI